MNKPLFLATLMRRVNAGLVMAAATPFIESTEKR
jgi:hypothetical protein